MPHVLNTPLARFNRLDGHAGTVLEDRDRYGKPGDCPMVRTYPVHRSRAEGIARGSGEWAVRGPTA